jgi:small subunit ribosomal protein S17
MAEETENTENTENTEEQIEETPAAPESVEETPLEAEAPAQEPEAAAEEPEAAGEEPAAEEPEAAAEEAEAAAEEPEAAAEEPEATVEEPAAEEPEAAAGEPAAEQEAAAPAPQSEPKKKGKRLPRRLRPQKTRPRHAPTGERKPIVRQPKPDHDRGRRQERRGVVVSSAMDKTIVVKVDVITSHQRYKKVIRRSVKFHAHDEQNTANVGDIVRIVETRPLSATKRWRLAEVVEAAK